MIKPRFPALLIFIIIIARFGWGQEGSIPGFEAKQYLKQAKINSYKKMKKVKKISLAEVNHKKNTRLCFPLSSLTK